MPGALIGAASHGLSTEQATRFFLLILALLVGIWLLSVLVKWLFSKLNSILKTNLHILWLTFKQKKRIEFFVPDIYSQK